MAKTQAEYQREYRERQKLTRKTNALETNALETNAQADLPSVGTVPAPFDQAEPVIGPLDVYSSDRWSFLQSRGHTWDADRQRSTRPGAHGSIIIGVTVPGDPVYTGACVA